MIGRIAYKLKSLIQRDEIAVYRRRIKSIGQNVVIEPGFGCGQPERLVLGNHVYIGPDAQFASAGGIRIDDGTIFGPRCRIWSVNHNYNSEVSLPYDGKIVLKPVHIGRGVWIGTEAIIMPGVTIGDGAVVAARAVVVKNVEPGAIVAGNPARPVRQRDPELLSRLLNGNRWYFEDKLQNRAPIEEVNLAVTEQFLARAISEHSQQRSNS